MNELVIREVLMHIVICSIFLILVFLFVKIYYSIISERRIKGFTLDSKNQSEISIVDIIINHFVKRIKGFSKGLSHSAVLTNYSKKFDKYLIYNNENTFKSIDLISFKFLIMILIQVLYLFSIIIKLSKFNIYTFLLISLLSFFLIDIIIIIIYKKQKKIIEEELLQAVVIMNSAFKSGKNIRQAIEIVKKELPSPIKEEFEVVSKDLDYGLSLSDAFNRFSKRVELEEAKYITSSLSLLSKTGGNIVTVFNMIERNFYDRLKIKNELRSLTASSKLLYRILISMPFIFIVVIILLNPTYFNSLLTTKIGIIIDCIMAFIYVLYILVIRKVMKVDEV
jgi:tight adherence protein B